MDRTKTFSTLTLVLLLSGCGRRADEFLVASENLTEQIILREIIVHYLEHRLGTPVTRRLYLGGTLIAHRVLLAGEIDL